MKISQQLSALKHALTAKESHGGLAVGSQAVLISAEESHGVLISDEESRRWFVPTTS